MRSHLAAPETLPKPSWRTRLPFFYGWVILGSMFLVQAVGYGVYYSFSVFFVALLEEFGWGRAPAAGVFSLYVLLIGVFSVASGALVDRIGPTRIVPAGGVVLALSLAACSRVAELWQFYLYFGVAGALGSAMAGWVPAVAVVSRWFALRRGSAIGIVGAGIGLGIVVMVPFCQYLIGTVGWRSAYLVLAGMSLFGIAPLAAFLLVGRPEELGLRPDGAALGVPSGPAPALRAGELVIDQKWASYPWSVASAIRTPRFWLLAANFMLSVSTNQMLWVHQAAYLVDGGYDRMLAASVVGLAGFFSIPAKVLWGMAADRFGRERSFTLGVSAMLMAILVLVLTRNFPGFWMLVLFAATFGAGYAVAAPVAPAAAGDLFAGRHFGAIFGVLSIFTGLGSAFGAWFAGFVFDTTGSYLVAFATAAACSTTSALCLWLASPRKVRRVAGRRIAG